jgi:hypothetical protein
MKPAPAEVVVRFESTPPGATVRLMVQSGQVLGTTPFERMMPCSTTAATFELERTGYQKAIQQIRLAHDTTILVTLAPLPVVAKPPSARAAKKPDPSEADKDGTASEAGR